MSKQVIILDTDLTAETFRTVCNLEGGTIERVIGLENFMGGIVGGLTPADVVIHNGAVSAKAKITFAGAPTNGQQMSLGNVTITAVSGSPTANQFQIGGSVAVTAANLAALINASFTGVMAAVVEAGSVSITAVVPGKSGNSLGISVGNLSNTTLESTFAGGSDGTSFESALL